MKGRIRSMVNVGTDGWEALTLDDRTLALLTIHYPLTQIHQGTYFKAFARKDVPNTESLIMALYTPPQTEGLIHWRPLVSTELEATVQLWENPDSVTGGTPFIPINANRISAKVALSQVVIDPTVTIGGGLLLAETQLGSAKNFGGEYELAEKFILKPETWYVIIATDTTAGGTNDMTIRMNWHLNKPYYEPE